AGKGNDLLPAGTEDYVHVRIQQRNIKKILTTDQGTADDYNKKEASEGVEGNLPAMVL
ncbi:Eukaryotic translation initiation factor 1, partial [Lemmus lemmus]